MHYCFTLGTGNRSSAVGSKRNAVDDAMRRVDLPSDLGSSIGSDIYQGITKYVADQADKIKNNEKDDKVIKNRADVATELPKADESSLRTDIYQGLTKYAAEQAVKAAEKMKSDRTDNPSRKDTSPNSREDTDKKVQQLADNVFKLFHNFFTSNSKESEKHDHLADIDNSIKKYESEYDSILNPKNKDDKDDSGEVSSGVSFAGLLSGATQPGAKAENSQMNNVTNYFGLLKNDYMYGNDAQTNEAISKIHQRAGRLLQRLYSNIARKQKHRELSRGRNNNGCCRHGIEMRNSEDAMIMGTNENESDRDIECKCIEQMYNPRKSNTRFDEKIHSYTGMTDMDSKQSYRDKLFNMDKMDKFNNMDRMDRFNNMDKMNKFNNIDQLEKLYIDKISHRRRPSFRKSGRFHRNRWQNNSTFETFPDTVIHHRQMFEPHLSPFIDNSKHQRGSNGFKDMGLTHKDGLVGLNGMNTTGSVADDPAAEDNIMGVGAGGMVSVGRLGSSSAGTNTGIFSLSNRKNRMKYPNLRNKVGDFSTHDKGIGKVGSLPPMNMNQEFAAGQGRGGDEANPLSLLDELQNKVLTKNIMQVEENEGDDAPLTSGVVLLPKHSNLNENPQSNVPRDFAGQAMGFFFDGDKKAARAGK